MSVTLRAAHLRSLRAACRGGRRAEGGGAGRLLGGRSSPPTRSTSPWTWTGPRRKGSMIGSAGVVVMDDTVSIPEALMVLARFYAHESCGQCTPCRESTGWIYKMTHRIVDGKGRKEDLDTILDVARRGTGTTICAFYDGAVGPYICYIEKFRERVRGPDAGAGAHAEADRRRQGDRGPRRDQPHRGRPRGRHRGPALLLSPRAVASRASAACAWWTSRRCRGRQIACNTQAAEGMVVQTETERVKDTRQVDDGVPPHQPSAGLPGVRSGRASAGCRSTT